MKNKKIITLFIIICVVLLLLIIGIFNHSKNKIQQENKYDFTNKIFSSFPNDKDDTDATVVIFNKDGKYYNFVTTHYEVSDLRSNSGTWKKNKDGNIYVEYDNAVYYDGGDLVEIANPDYFNIRRNNYTLVKKNYPYNTILKFNINYNGNSNAYKYYLTIDDVIYYPIYEFDKEEDLYKKLEEMYGKIYTMLVDDNIEITE